MNDFKVKMDELTQERNEWLSRLETLRNGLEQHRLERQREIQDGLRQQQVEAMQGLQERQRDDLGAMFGGIGGSAGAISDSTFGVISADLGTPPSWSCVQADKASRPSRIRRAFRWLGNIWRQWRACRRERKNAWHVHRFWQRKDVIEI